ncbi:MAG: hypothetical protein WCZ87_13010 [Thiohalobacteraceae bacterium]
MKTFRSDHWSINLPDDWEEEQDDEGVTLFDPQASGALKISAMPQGQTVDDGFLEYMAAEHLEAGAEPEEAELGDFDGLMLSYGDAELYWREWYLRADELMLYVTYHCPLADEGKQDDEVDAILETLQLA